MTMTLQTRLEYPSSYAQEVGGVCQMAAVGTFEILKHLRDAAALIGFESSTAAGRSRYLPGGIWCGYGMGRVWAGQHSLQHGGSKLGANKRPVSTPPASVLYAMKPTFSWKGDAASACERA